MSKITGVTTGGLLRGPGGFKDLKGFGHGYDQDYHAVHGETEALTIRHTGTRVLPSSVALERERLPGGGPTNLIGP
ncbi:hypothetical protein D3C75_1210770 [compost metagenome]